MKPVNVLALWERVHGRLDERWRFQFLNDPRVHEICAYSLAVLEPAIKAHKRLDAVLRAVKVATPPAPDRIPLGERTRRGRASGRIWDPPADPGSTDPRYR